MTNFKLGKINAGLAVAALSIAAVSTAWAQGPDGPGGMGPHRPPMERAMGPGGPGGPGGPKGEMGPMARWWNSPHAIEKFKLTETQRKTMDDIYQQHRLTLVDLHATLEKAELQMEPLIRADSPDENKILSQIDRVAQARAELEKANARMLLGLRKQLTPEQWKQFEAERAARHDGRGDGRGEGRGPGREGLRQHRDWHGPADSGGPGLKNQTPPPPPAPNGQGAAGPGPMGPDGPDTQAGDVNEQE